jgi:hypothetical protein
MQFSDIELSSIGGGGPSEKDFGHRLQEALTRNDTLALVRIDTFGGEWFEYRSGCFLELQKERIASFGDHQGNPAPSADTAYANDLDGGVQQPISIHQAAPIVGQ